MTASPDLRTPQLASPDLLRSVFRQHAAGVAVITASGPAGPVGFTATSLSSAAAEPPLVSFGIGTGSSSWPVIAESEYVGKRFREGGCTGCPWTSVVGVVSEVKYAGLDKPDQGTVYWPLSGSLSRYLVVRTHTDPALVASNDRILEYARGGGLVIVQYQQYAFVDGGFAPFRLTIARWLTPDKNWINGKGIIPEIVASNEGAPADSDPQLARALEVLASQSAGSLRPAA